MLSKLRRRNKNVNDVPFEESPPQDIPTQVEGNVGMVDFSVTSEGENSAAIDDAYLISEPKGCIGKIRAAVGSIVNRELFKNVIIILIMINAIMMGIGTFEFVKHNPEMNSAFEWTDQAFLIIFTIELLLQFIYRGHRLFFDGWLVFDFVIVLLSWSLQSFQIIRAFRIFRALRLITRIQSLQNLVVAIISVLPRLFAIICLMALIFYIFAVMFTQLFRELDLDGENYFQSMEFTMFTLFQLMTLEWSEITRNVMAEEPLAWIPILSFIMISSFIVYNLVVAVVCDSIFILRERTKKEEERESEYNPQKVFAKLSDQVVDLQRSQDGIQLKLEQLALLLRDVGVVKIRK